LSDTVERFDMEKYMGLLCQVLALLVLFEWGYAANSKNAYVTIHYEGTSKDDEYVLGIRTLVKSLQISGTKADIVVLLADNVRPSTKETFKRDGCIVKDVKNIKNPYR
jgi:hypothetical protein